MVSCIISIDDEFWPAQDLGKAVHVTSIEECPGQQYSEIEAGYQD